MKPALYAILFLVLSLGAAASAHSGRKNGRLHDKFGRLIKREDSVLIFNFLIVLYGALAVFLFLAAALFAIEVFDQDLSTRIGRLIFGA